MNNHCGAGLGLFPPDTAHFAQSPYALIFLARFPFTSRTGCWGCDCINLRTIGFEEIRIKLKTLDLHESESIAGHPKQTNTFFTQTHFTRSFPRFYFYYPVAVLHRY